MYVKVIFKSAKLVIPNRKKNSDKVNNLVVNNGKIEGITCDDRENYVDINEPIKFEQVANMLHVLFGDRPVPTYRRSIRTRLSEIDKIAKTGYYKIYNPYSYITNNGNIKPFTEFTQGKKMVFNSHASIYTESENGTYKGQITWSTLKGRFIYKQDVYNDIMSHIKFWTGNDNIENEISLINALHVIKNSEFRSEAVEYFDNIHLKPFCGIITCDPKIDTAPFNYYTSRLATRTINMYPNQKVSLDGEFLFQVTENEYNKLIKGSRLATFLDNGYAEVICERIDDSDIDFDKYVKL